MIQGLHIRRGLVFIVLYLCSFYVAGMIWLAVVTSRQEPMSNVLYIIFQICCIPIILLLAKWYFKKIQPSFRRGVMLGLATVFLLNIFLVVMALISIRTGVSGGTLQALSTVLGDLYTEWRVYLPMIVVLATTAYAGFEFDRTYTFDELVGLKKR